MSDYCVTEDGRVFNLSPLREGKGILELVDGAWVKPTRPIYGDSLYNSRVVEETDLHLYAPKSEKAQ